MRFLEYDLATGRIVSEIECDFEPEPVDGTGLLRISDDEEVDTINYAVRDGVLVKISETSQERLERERIRREHGEQCRRRLKSMVFELGAAQLFEDEEKIKSLKREAASMKAYI